MSVFDVKHIIILLAQIIIRFMLRHSGKRS